MTADKQSAAPPVEREKLLPVVAYGYENTRPTERAALMMVKLSNADDQYPELATPLVRLSDACALLASPPIPAGQEVPAEFEAWVCQQMPAGTEIGDPKWWAPRIWRAAAHFGFAGETIPAASATTKEK